MVLGGGPWRKSGKIDVKLKQEEYWAIAQVMNWVSADYAAQQAVGVEKANGEMPTEGIRVSFSRGGDLSATNEHGESGLRKSNAALRVLRGQGN